MRAAILIAVAIGLYTVADVTGATGALLAVLGGLGTACMAVGALSLKDPA